MSKSGIKVLRGKAHPLGAKVFSNGVNFSLFAKNADQVELLLFHPGEHAKPYETLTLDPRKNKTFYYWHCFIPNLKPGVWYAYRAHGKNDLNSNFRFDGSKVLLDPYAKAVVSDTWDRDAACQPGFNNVETAFKGVVVDMEDYDWEWDQPLNRSYAETVIYEMHVGGFTKNPNSGVADPWKGTYRGLVEKIPYLKELGVTAVELLPVQQFDPYDTPSHLTNYWGYSPVNFFAPHCGYSSVEDPIGCLNEFRDMVKALHLAGIELILDVVFNHTAEGGLGGPTFSFRGLENQAYYIMDEFFQYKNYSGTGNTMNANHSIVRRMIMDSLKHWVAEMHVDGFRFDLASVLSRDERGTPLENPPILWGIESNPILASSKIIAEAWDLESYQLGRFVGDRWAEWNGRYRDDVRCFIKGDRNMVFSMANRITGSPDLFRTEGRDPNRSINFVTCHDGFTLRDLVSYNFKHNEANLEDNRDGHNANYSWNCGVEGPTDDPKVRALREKQMRNFLTALLTSQGTPMISMGDEIGRTQHGNNNAYCQDNELSWMDWNLLDENRELFEFTKKLIRLNLATEYFQETTFWTLNRDPNTTRGTWHGVKLHEPDFGFNSHSLAGTLHNPDYPFDIHVMINAWSEPLEFELPEPPDPSHQYWYRLIDTSQPHPYDITLPKDANHVLKNPTRVEGRSIVMAMAPREEKK
jgi:glycogen operon protein